MTDDLSRDDEARRLLEEALSGPEGEKAVELSEVHNSVVALMGSLSGMSALVG